MSCFGAVERLLRLVLKTAGVLLVMVRAMLLVVRVGVVRRRDAMRRRGRCGARSIGASALRLGAQPGVIVG